MKSAGKVPRHRLVIDLGFRLDWLFEKCHCADWFKFLVNTEFASIFRSFVRTRLTNLWDTVYSTAKRQSQQKF